MSGGRCITITNVFGPLNRGDFELFNQTLTTLRQAGPVYIRAVARDPEGCRLHFPDIDIYPQPGVAPEINGRMGRVVALIRTLLLYIAAWIPSARLLLPASHQSSLKAIESADLVIACPGGYLTSTSWSFYPQVAQLSYAVRQGKEVWLAPMSIGPAHRRIHRFLLKQMLQRASRVYVRESWSERFCQQLGVSAVRSSDLALRPAREWLHEATESHTADYITATVVRWDFPEEPNPDLARDRYHEALAEALNSTGRSTGLPVHLLLQVDNDRTVTEAVASRLNVPHKIVRVDTPDEYRQILRHSQLMFASRFHSAIFSMCVGCPTVVISYLPKGRYMMEDMGLGALVHDISTVTPDGLMRSAKLLVCPNGGFAERTKMAILRATLDDANPFEAELYAHLALTRPRH